MTANVSSRSPRCIRSLFIAAITASITISAAHAQPAAATPAKPPTPAKTQAPASRTDEFQTLLLSSGKKISYRVLLPDRYDDTKPAPVLIALPPGDQSRTMVEAGMSRYWNVGPSKGWVVISPAAMDGVTFVDAPIETFQEFLDAMTTLYPAEGNKVHLAGVSNGGRSAIRLATHLPSRFASVVALPGFAPTADDFGRLSEIACPVRILAGSNDPRWVTEGRATVDRLQALGKDASIEVRPGDGHLLNIPGEDLFTLLDRLRTTSPSASPTATPTPTPIPTPSTQPTSTTTPTSSPTTSAPDPIAIITVLNDFHDAASKADAARYFAHFTPNGVFLGTDDSERWTVDEFRTYAEPYFSKGKGWTYTPSDRHIDFTADGTVAWFDEKLDNDKYGRCRGSGILLYQNGLWKIAQYNLTVPIPNDMLAGVAQQIRDAAKGTK